MKIPEWLLWFVAGGLGGAVRMFSRPEEGWLRRVGTSLAGGVVAIYLTPLAAPIAAKYLTGYEVPIGGVYGAVGFLSGMAGLSICEGIIRRVKRMIDGGDSGTDKSATNR